MKKIYTEDTITRINKVLSSKATHALSRKEQATLLNKKGFRKPRGGKYTNKDVYNFIYRYAN